jgi:hypothetical protein
MIVLRTSLLLLEAEFLEVYALQFVGVDHVCTSILKLIIILVGSIYKFKSGYP